MRYSVNAGNAGSGKTHYSKQRIMLSTEKFLVIVPSIALADQYAEVGHVIHTENSNEGVSKEVFARINERVLVITHQAFLKNTNKKAVCDNRHIIQDEAMTVQKHFDLRLKIHIAWDDMFSYKPKGSWLQLTANITKINEYILDADTMDNITLLNELVSTPQIIYVRTTDLQEMQTAYSYISPTIYDGALSVTINCANFRNVIQYYVWSKIFSVEFSFIKDFQKYEANGLQLHVADQNVNALTYNKEDPLIRLRVIDYCQLMSIGNPVVYVDNNSNEDVPNEVWTRIKHNAHGLNEFSNVKHIAFLSAINLNNTIISHITEHLSITPTQLRNAILGEMAHQIIMRGSLRQQNGLMRTSECHVYLMEESLAFYLMDEVFNCPIHISIPDSSRKGAEKKIPATSQERNKARLIRKVHPTHYSDDKKYGVHELKRLPIWKMTGARGKILPENKEFWDNLPQSKWTTEV